MLKLLMKVREFKADNLLKFTPNTLNPSSEKLLFLYC